MIIDTQIVVSGQASDIGKTTFIEKAINNLDNKVAVVKCSVGKEKSKSIVKREDNLNPENLTDTGRFCKAGASDSIFIHTTKDQLKNRLDKAMSLIKNDVKYIIYEGNSLLNYIRPDLLFYLKHREKKAKVSAKMAEAKADIIIEAKLKENEVIFPPQNIEIATDSITCYKAHLLANIMDYKVSRIGKLLSSQGVKIKDCQLGLF